MSVNIKQNDGSLKAIAGQAESVEIIDNLTTEDSDKALSAKQGKVLKDLIDEGGSASIEYGDETAFNTWSATAKDGEIFVRTDDNQGGSGGSGEIYDDTERVIGTWFGKPLYRKVLNFGAMPNATRKYVNHNISNLDYVLNLYGFAYAPSGYIRIPHTVYDNLPYSNYITINSTQVSISCGTDRSSMNCYVVIEYTKVGD